MLALHHKYWTGTRLLALAATALTLLIFIGANVHLVKVAFQTRPDCILTPEMKGVAALRPAKPSC